MNPLVNPLSEITLHIPPASHSQEPHQFIFRGEKSCRRKISLSIDAGASAQVIVYDHGVDSKKFPSLQTEQDVEIHLAPGASLEYYEIEESSTHARRSSRMLVHQDAGSRLLIHALTLHNGQSGNDYRIHIDGPDAELSFFALAVLDRRRRLDTSTHVIHATPGSKSHELVKSLIQGHASSFFNGHILVAPGAEKTIAGQTNRTLCLSPYARAFSSPQLEIYADDVRCTHGMSSGQLDTDALFYLQSRGIPQPQALRLLSLAFLADILHTIRIPPLHARLHSSLLARLQPSPPSPSTSSPSSSSSSPAVIPAKAGIPRGNSTALLE